MSLFKIITKDCWRIAIWRIEESLDEILEITSPSIKLKREIESYSRENRKIEKLLATHLSSLLCEGFVEIGYLSNGAPYILDSEFKLSITHTQGWVAVQISNVFQPGVDIEYKSDRVLRIAHKFISNSELAFISEVHRVDFYNLLWCSKEVLYKVAHLEGVDFIDNLAILPFELSQSGTLVGNSVFDSVKESYMLEYSISDDWYLVYRIN